MPKQSHSRGQGKHIPTAAEVATSNTTADRFLGGGKRLSWMTGSAAGATPRRPSTIAAPLRPTRPNLPVDLTSDAGAAALLSPAPSDEPSPNTSSPHDSPPTSRLGVSAPNKMIANTSGGGNKPPSSMTSPSSPDAIFNGQQYANSAHGLSLTTRVRPESHPRSEPSSATSLVQNLSPQNPRPLPSTLLPHTMVPEVSGPTILSPSHMSPITSQSPQAAMPTAGGTSQPLKRKRSDDPTPGSYAAFLPVINTHVTAVGASRLGDGFYLVVHQLYCLWSSQPESVYEMFSQKKEIIDGAFQIVHYLLKDNTEVHPVHLDFFEQFPRRVQRDATYLPAIGTFFERLSFHWRRLIEECQQRLWPLLMDEMVGILCCHSSQVQSILFTSSRRLMSIPDGPCSQRMEAQFQNEQRLYQGRDQLPSAITPQLLESRNAQLIANYRQLVSQSRATEGFRAPPQHSQVFGQTIGPGAPYSQQAIATTPFNTQASLTGTRSMTPLLPTQVQPQQSVPIPSISPHMGSPYHQNLTQLRPPVVPSPHQRGISPRQPQFYMAPSSQQQFQTPLQHFATSPRSQFVSAPSQPTRVLNPPQHPQVPRVAASLPPSTLPQRTGAARPSSYPPIANRDMTPPQSGARSLGPGVSPSALQSPHVPAQSGGNPMDSMVLARRNQQTPRRDWPDAPSDQKSLQVSLHQILIRSPKRSLEILPGAAASATERYYQSVVRMAIAGQPIHSQSFVQTFSFTVLEAEVKRLSKLRVSGALHPPHSTFSEGSLRYRLRCCLRSGERLDGQLDDSDWVSLATSWPQCIFIQFNDQHLTLRRQNHYGKDLPAELTEHVRAGTNTIRVSFPDNLRETRAKNSTFFIGVEVIETSSQSHIVQQLRHSGRDAAAITRRKIATRLGGSSRGDEEFSVVQNELSVEVADPFTSRIFNVPVRGAKCPHLECFDLNTWLETRSAAQPPTTCQHIVRDTCERDAVQPSHADMWKCPLCLGDARPGSLRIDDFMVEVREQLEMDDKLNTKFILVVADGTWRPVIEGSDRHENRKSHGSHESDAEKADKPAQGPRSRKSSEVPRGHPERPIEID